MARHAETSGEPTLPDEELLIRYRESGEKVLFAQLVARYEHELFNYLRRFLGDSEMAEDVFQAAFLQVHLKCEQFEPGRSFRPWLYAIATNQAIDAQRRNRRHRMVSLDRVTERDGGDAGKLADLLVSADPDPLDEVSRFERGDWVQQAVDQLAGPMRQVVELVYYQGMKYREAAEVMDIPVGTVKSRLHAAIMKLNDTWKNTHTQQAQ